MSRTRHRRLRIVAQVVIGVLLVISTGIGGLYIYLNGNIHTDPLNVLGDRPGQQPSLDILLIGSDTRTGDSAEFQGTGADAVIGARSDTTVLVHLPAGGGRALLISFPRDLWVEQPACRRPGKQPSEPSAGRFNRAFSIGGASCTAKVVESLTHIRIDDYVQVDFASFRRIVNALGGVPFCTPVALNDPAVPRQGSTPGHGTGLALPKGTSTLNGDQALALVRARYGLGDGGDLGRIQRQQQFLGAVVRRATSSRLLFNPPRLVRFLDAATGSVTTGGMKLGGLQHLADRLKGLDPGTLTFVTVPTTPRSDGATLALAQPAADALFGTLRSDAPVPGAKSPVGRITVTIPPSAVHLRVLNGTNEKGLAKRAAADLRALGFQVEGVARADSQAYTETVVRHGPAKADSSQTVLAAVPSSASQLDGSLHSTLELVIGSSYRGTRPVQVVGTTGKPPITAADDPCR